MFCSSYSTTVLCWLETSWLWDLDRKRTKTRGMHLNARHQIQTSRPSSIYDVKESWIRANLFVVFTIGLNKSRGKAMASNTSARAVKKLTEMWSMRESSLAAELRRKVIIMRRQDESLSGTDAITVQISTASAQLKVNTYKKHTMLEMVVELTKPEGCKNTRTQTRPIFHGNKAVDLGNEN